MMLRFLTFLLCVGFGFSAHSAKPSCEDGISTPAFSYVTTVKLAVDAGELSTEHLMWLMRQPQPVDPIVAPQSPKNLSFKQKLRRAIPLITSEQWQIVKTHVQTLLSKSDEQVAQRQAAVDVTTNIFAIRSAGFKLPSGENFVRSFTSSGRDTFIFTRDQTHSYIYNLRTQTKTSYPPPIFPQSYDFFETSWGDVLLALIADKQLIVSNIATGTKVFSKINHFMPSYMPLLFESNGLLNIALGKSGIVQVMEREAMILQKRIYVMPDSSHREEEFKNWEHVVRLKDGHLYARTIVSDENKLSIHLRDLSSEHEILNVEGVQFKSQNKFSQSLLIYDHGPKITVGAVAENWQEVDEKNKITTPLLFDGASHAISSLVHPGDQSVSATIRLIGGLFKLHILNIPRNELKEIVLPFAQDSSWISSSGEPNLFRTEQGPWLYGWETRDGQRIKLHLYNLNTEELVALTPPPDIENVSGIFHDANDGRILVAIQTKHSHWELYQVFGPEGHRQ